VPIFIGRGAPFRLRTGHSITSGFALDAAMRVRKSAPFAPHDANLFRVYLDARASAWRWSRRWLPDSTVRSPIQCIWRRASHGLGAPPAEGAEIRQIHASLRKIKNINIIHFM
jgi:hypothetical protein